LIEQEKGREDDWFRKNEKELIEAARVARERREKERAEHEKKEERAALKKLHHMKCPKCGHDMKEKDLEGLSVDVCSFCEGIYFDAGELDKLFLKRDADRRTLLGRLLKLKL
jgi:acetyl-CoA carboxylase beta subunit